MNKDYAGPDAHLTKKDYADALQVGNASNILGVTSSFQDVLRSLREEMCLRGIFGSNWVSEHPITQMYACQIMLLSTGRDLSLEVFYEEAQEYVRLRAV